MDTYMIAILTGIIVFIMMIVVFMIINKLRLNRANLEAQRIIEDAESKADTQLKQSILEAKTQSYEIKLNAEKELKSLRKELQDSENKLGRREENLSFREANLIEKENNISRKQSELDSKKTVLDKMEVELNNRIDVQVQELERITSLSVDTAKAELMDIVEKRMEQETLAYIKEQEDLAKEQADNVARNIISLAISRLSQDEVTQNTAAVINLPNEEMKGRIIGREGRNIRAFEQATGVDLLIDDTPEIITVSSFDPIRREVARLSLETLIQDGRIQPGRIEEIVAKTQKELHTVIQKTGQDTLFELGLVKLTAN